MSHFGWMIFWCIILMLKSFQGTPPSTWQHPIEKEPCCNTLLSVFAIGLTEHLKDSSTFYLPNKNTSSTCLYYFNLRLHALSIPPKMIPLSFPNPTRFLFNASVCAGIKTTNDWRQRVGMVNLVDTSCNGIFWF